MGSIINRFVCFDKTLVIHVNKDSHVVSVQKNYNHAGQLILNSQVNAIRFFRQLEQKWFHRTAEGQQIWELFLIVGLG